MNDDERLRQLLTDAVSDIEPDDRIEELRASVRPPPRPVAALHARPWYAAAAIVAAVICVVAYVTSVASHHSSEPGFATQGKDSSGPPTVIATDTAASDPSTSPTGDTQEYAVYYVGKDPQDQPVLFRELRRGGASRSAGQLAEEGLQSTPLDPDYATAWSTGDLRDPRLRPGTGIIAVTLGYPSLQHRPADMSPKYARAAVQQVVYTLQAAFHSHLPVQFELDAGPVDTVLGVPTTSPVEAGRVYDTLSQMSISTPNQGDTVSGDRLHVSGMNNGYEGTASVYLVREGRQYAAKPTIGGFGGDRLFPWEVTLDLSEVPPGTYTLVAQNDSGSEKDTPAKDTRVITVE
jgi:hypothetical protein